MVLLDGLKHMAHGLVNYLEHGWAQVGQVDSTFSCNTETSGSLYSHALLILTGSSKSKNQVVHKQMFKDLPSSKCPVSVERSMLDL